jgi:chromosome segregation ATPase
MRGRVREGEGEVQSLRAALATAQGELVGKEKRARVMEEGKRAATLALEAEVRQKEEREAGYKAQVAALEKAAQATQARLDAQVAALGKELAGSRREVECGKVAKGEMGVSLAALEGRLKGVEGEREGLVARVGVLEGEVEVMRERGVVADREKEGLQASLSTTTAQLAEAHAKVSLLTLTLEESKAEALGLGEEVGKLQGEVGAMAVSLSTLHSHHQDSLSTSSLYLRKLRVSLLTTVLLVMALTATFLWGGGYNGAWAPHLLLGTSPTQDGGVMGSSGSGGPPSSLAASSSPFEGGMLGLSQGPPAVQKWGPEGGATGGDNGDL